MYVIYILQGIRNRGPANSRRQCTSDPDLGYAQFRDNSPRREGRRHTLGLIDVQAVI